ncbi:flavin monoamine oxidase family protein [Tahibacter soli]|uniref:NAD(P)/FAD-dependent oxidoreductase n=1 Tax=Tahibacter soli TaxID=2983605 RepID=A0A9X4BGS0_9GAMM|nr:NAD(P)/FAD-dependent oxidoreductase [Tahibacter soli]MDC8011443.1 NAD(P)/FAD-dependent oxidoreductase [Tahibacter soli]
MSRTPLMRVLRRAFSVARASQTGAVPLDETIARAFEARADASRRRFLRQGATAAAALTLASCRHIPLYTPPTEEDVVVVGGGIAGLTAAWRLRQAGVGATVYEAQNRIGGRILSLAGHFADGQVCELGGELIDTGHARMRALADEFGLPLDDLAGTETPGHDDTWYFGGAHRSEHEIIAAFAPIAQALARDQAILGDVDITYRTPGDAAAFDRLSIAQWFDANGVSGWMRTLLDVAYTTEMGLECDEQSALNLLTFIDAGTDAFRIFGESDERYHVRGGNDRIPTAIAKHLSGAIETGAALEAIAQDSSGGYRLTFRRGSSSVDVRAKQVVLAIPLTTLRQVQLSVELPPVEQRALAQLRYGTNAKLMIGVNERVWRTRARGNGSLMCDLAPQTTWETSRQQAGSAGILTNFTGGRHGLAIGEGTPKQQADRAVAELDRVFPGLASARAGAREARFHWPTHPWARGSYLCFAPGQWTTLRGAFGEPAGNLFFAGEHCSLDNQGFMEGGVESGEAAAQQVLAARGVAKTAGLAHVAQRVVG